MEISLQELAAALEKTDVLQGYADTRDGRIILMGEDESDARTEAASREEERMERLLSIEEDWQRYVPLPDIYDAEIRSIMQTFAEKAPPLRKPCAALLPGCAFDVRCRAFLWRRPGRRIFRRVFSRLRGIGARRMRSPTANEFVKNFLKGEKTH